MSSFLSACLSIFSQIALPCFYVSQERRAKQVHHKTFDRHTNKMKKLEQNFHRRFFTGSEKIKPSSNFTCLHLFICCLLNPRRRQVTTGGYCNKMTFRIDASQKKYHLKQFLFACLYSIK